MKFEHSTPAQNQAEVRRRFRESSGLETLRIGTWIVETMTVDQIKAVFGMTTGEANSLRGRLTALKNQLRSLEQVKGE